MHMCRSVIIWELIPGRSGTRNQGRGKANVSMRYQVGPCNRWLLLDLAWTFWGASCNVSSQNYQPQLQQGEIFVHWYLPCLIKGGPIILAFLNCTLMSVLQVPVGSHTLASEKPRQERTSVFAVLVCLEPCLEAVWVVAAGARCGAHGICTGTRYKGCRGIGRALDLRKQTSGTPSTASVNDWRTLACVSAVLHTHPPSSHHQISSAWNLPSSLRYWLSTSVTGSVLGAGHAAVSKTTASLLLRSLYSSGQRQTI